MASREDRFTKVQMMERMADYYRVGIEGLRKWRHSKKIIDLGSQVRCWTGRSSHPGCNVCARVG